MQPELAFNKAVYFDCNATTPTHPLAAKAALSAMSSLYGNPSSTHTSGLQAKFVLDSARKSAAQAINVDPKTIVFTGGATEAIQTAVFSVLQKARHSGVAHGAKLLYGATEHKAVPEALHYWAESLGLPYKVVKIGVERNGRIDLSHLRAELPGAILLCSMAVNNETGVIQDLEAIQKALTGHRSTVSWLVDCVQGLGKIDLKLKKLGVDYAAFSGHKLYAPKGVGFLYTRTGASLSPMMVGGGQERGMRSGTENIPGIAAMAAVLNKIDDFEIFSPSSKLLEYRTRLVEQLEYSFPKISFNAPLEVTVPTTLNFSIPGLSSKELTDLFDSAGLCVSAGSACSAGTVRPSFVLEAMGLPLWRSSGALRLSFGPCTTELEVASACRMIRESALALQNASRLEAVDEAPFSSFLDDGVLQFATGASNSWLIVDRESSNCFVIDPVEESSEQISQLIQRQKLRAVAIVDTHSHGDHQSAGPTLLNALPDHRNSPGTEMDSLGWFRRSPTLIQVKLEDGTSAQAIRMTDTEEFKALVRVPTPGHTDDSTILLYGVVRSGRLCASDIQFAFPGDTILSGGLGRTNFPSSDAKGLFKSLQKIRSVVGPTTLLCPAHDYNGSFATNLETEEKENSVFKLVVDNNISSFLVEKERIDLRLAAIETSFQGMVCGVSARPFDESVTDMSIPFAKFDPKSQIVIDVREPQEFLVFREWSLLGFAAPPKNVPLSRLVNFMSSHGPADKDFIFICGSGVRSLAAAQAVRRLRLGNAFSLEGGLALYKLSRQSFLK